MNCKENAVTELCRMYQMEANRDAILAALQKSIHGERLSDLEYRVVKEACGLGLLMHDSTRRYVPADIKAMDAIYGSEHRPDEAGISTCTFSPIGAETT